MKKSIIVILTICLTFLFVSNIVMAADPEVVLRISNAGPANPNDKTYIANDTFKRIVEKRTNGRIKVENYHASELGNERETFEGITMGTIEMGSLTTGSLPGFFKDIMVLDIPYLFESETIAWAVMEGPFGQMMAKRLREQTGIRTLAWADHGFRHFTNSKRAINSPEDLKGLKIRTLENPAHMKMLEAMGADPVPMGFNELYMALQQGTVDGQYNPLVLIDLMKFYEVQEHLTLDGHVYVYLGLFINDDLYNSLSEADQRIIKDAAEVWKNVHNGMCKRQNLTSYATLVEEGMKVTTPDLEPFKKATQQPVIEYLEKEIGRDLIDQLLEAVEETKEEFYSSEVM